MPDKVDRPRRRRLNRSLVIKKAAEMADDAGSASAVSLTALAQALHIRPPSLYNHVASLEDLRYGMTLYGANLLLDALRGASLGLVGREALVATADAYRRFVRAHPGIYPLTIEAPEPGDEALVALSQEILQHFLLILASIGLEGEDAIHAIRGLRAILHGFTSLEASAGFKMPLDADESYRRLVQTYLDGLHP